MHGNDLDTVLVAIDSSLKEPYIRLTIDGPLATWVKVNQPAVEVVIYSSKRPGKFLVKLNEIVERWRWSGGTARAYIISFLSIALLFPLRRHIPRAKRSQLFKSSLVELIIPIPEALFMQRWKKLAILRYFLEETSHQFILLVTPSCYIDKDELIRTISTLPKHRNLYAGPIKENHDCKFISGACLILNRDMAQVLLKNCASIPTHTMDDVGIGILAAQLKIDLTPLDAISIDDPESLDLLRGKAKFYVRLKSGSAGARSDAELMRELHKDYGG